MLKICNIASSLIHFDYRFAALANANPLHWNVEIFLDESHVVLCVFGQVTEISNVCCRLLPARQRYVFNLDLGEV